MPNIANAGWQGNLKEGKGGFNTGGIDGEFSFKSRFEDENDKGANPEQLIGAAHAACFSMALSNDLAQHGHEPESVETTVEVTVKIVDGTPTITKAASARSARCRASTPSTSPSTRSGQEGLHHLARPRGIDEITLETDFDG